MKKKIKQNKRDFDERFDEAEANIDFSSGSKNSGLSKTTKFPPLDVPNWLASEIERIAQFQANSKASVIRQLLVEAIEQRRHKMAS